MISEANLVGGFAMSSMAGSSLKISNQVMKDLAINENMRFACSCFELDRRLKVLENGSIGLTSWRSINPNWAGPL